MRLYSPYEKLAHDRAIIADQDTKLAKAIEALKAVRDGQVIDLTAVIAELEDETGYGAPVPS